MKKVDLTKEVMGKVVGFEKSQIKWWLGRFFVILTVLLGVLGFCILIFQQLLTDLRISELVSLWNEDTEIVSEFWQDTIGIIWEEIPHEIIYLVIFILLILIIYIVKSRQKMKIISKKLKYLEKYKKSV